MLLNPTGTGLGWVQDPTDDRDEDAVKLMASVPVTVPTSWSNRDLVQVLEQGGLGSCTANATGQAVRAAELVEQVEEGKTLEQAKEDTPFPSRLFVYYLARAWQGRQLFDDGTYIRLCFTTINKYGFPPEYVWPYSDDIDPRTGAFAKMPSAEAFRQAYDQRDSVANKQANLISYARISATGSARIDQIKQASAQRHLIVFGTLVTNRFCSDMSANGGKPIDPPTTAESSEIAGGHAMCIGGYDAQGAKIVNSWSEQFGDRGWCTFSWDYLAWHETTDLWIVKRAPLLQKAA